MRLRRNDSGQYTHAAITQLEKGIESVLKQQYNPAGGSNGMLDLLNHNNKGPQANMTATAAAYSVHQRKKRGTNLHKRAPLWHPKSRFALTRKTKPIGATSSTRH